MRDIVVLESRYSTTGRYTTWDFLRPILPVIGDGGKWVCGMERVAGQEECVIYSFRINGESSFEAALLERRQVIKCGGMTLPWTACIENTPNLKEQYYTLDALMQLSGGLASPIPSSRFTV
ncbi:hypothetical protein EDB83DRAFT_2368938 [Lactarius deliciosus]|nr:hypothetical protein EDB83DRAFT_2368938 [Lactarius deliciosus]